MNYLQYFAACTSFIGVILNIKKSKWGFFFYGISTITWLFWSFPQRFWGVFGIQAVFLIMNIIGFRAWSKSLTQSVPNAQ